MSILAAENTTGIAIISAVCIAGGWLLLVALWFFVFRRVDEVEPPTVGEAVLEESGGRPASSASAGAADGAPRRE